MARTFEELNSNYIDAREQWGVHVDNCPDCERSPFACEEGQSLHSAWQAAWSAAKRKWDEMSEDEKDEFREAEAGRSADD